MCVVKTRAILETPPLSDILQRVGCSISRNYEFSYKNFHFGSPRIGASDSKGKQKGRNDDCNTLIGPVMQWLRRKTSNLKVLSSNLDAARGPVPRSRATRAGRAPGPVRDDGRRGAEQSGSGEGKGEGEGEGEGEEKRERRERERARGKGGRERKRPRLQFHGHHRCHFLRTRRTPLLRARRLHCRARSGSTRAVGRARLSRAAYRARTPVARGRADRRTRPPRMSQKLPRAP